MTELEKLKKEIAELKRQAEEWRTFAVIESDKCCEIKDDVRAIAKEGIKQYHKLLKALSQR